jgi:hypothetical protein
MDNIITIAIGSGTEPVTYHVMDTTAPVDYDGFGTFTITEFEDVRTVLIRDEHYQWQTGRYGSGMKTCQPTIHDIGAIQQALWKRLLGRE